MSVSGDPAHAGALLLTGRPGVGKTTVIERAVRRLDDRVVRGFFTEEIRQGGSRLGFRLVPFEGEPRILAHVDIASPARVSRYGVDVEMLDEVVATLLRPDPAVDLYIIDEIGKMECYSARFVAGVRSLLGQGAPLLATVARRGSGLIAEVKARPGVTLWEVNRANREELPDRIIEQLQRRARWPAGA